LVATPTTITLEGFRLMNQLKYTISDFDNQHYFVSFYIENHTKPSALLVYPINDVNSGNITTDLLSKLSLQKFGMKAEQQAQFSSSIEDKLITSIYSILSERLNSNNDFYLFQDLIESFKQKSLQDYSSFRKYNVDRRTVIAACAMLYAKKTKISIPNSFNYFSKKFNCQIVSNRVATRYVNRIKTLIKTPNGYQYLVNLLGLNIVEYLKLY